MAEEHLGGHRAEHRRQVGGEVHQDVVDRQHPDERAGLVDDRQPADRMGGEQRIDLTDVGGRRRW